MAVAALAVTSFMLFFGVYPLLTILRTLMTASADFTSGYGAADIASLLLQAGTQAALSATLTLGVGLPVAYLMSRFEFFGRRALEALVTLPFVLPTMVTGLGLRGVLEGVIPQGLGLVVLGHAFVNIAVVLRFVGTAIEQIDERLFVQARSLGASELRMWRSIGLPLLMPAIIRAGLLVFGFSFSSLSLILVLGTRTNRTFETEVLRQVSLLLDFQGAAINTVVQLAWIAMVLLLSARFARRSQGSRWVANSRVQLSAHPVWLLVAALVTAVYLAPFVWLVHQSVTTTSGFTLSQWGNVLAGSAVERFDFAPTVFRSVLLALNAAAVSIVVASLCASLATQKHSRLLRAVSRFALLPMMLTSATVGLGMLLAYARPPFEWERGGAALVLAQSLLAIPIAYAFMITRLEEVDERFLVVATSLGATQWQAWKATYLPTLLSASAAAMGLATVLALGEFGAASFLADFQSPNLSVLLMRWLGKPSETALSSAAVLAVVLVVLALGSLMASEAASRRTRRVRT